MAGSAADVHEQAAALAPHVRKHRAIYAYRPEKIRVHLALRLFGGDRFGQPTQVIASVVDSHIDASSFGDGGIHGPPHRSIIGYV